MRPPTGVRATVALAAVAAVAAAHAEARSPQRAQVVAGPAVVGGLLDIFGFGAQVGLPLICGLGTAAVSSGTSQVGVGERQAATVLVAADSGCGTASTEGSAFVAKGQAADTPLDAINPVVNPLIARGAGTTTGVATTYAPALGPAAPTLAGVGGTLTFFQGS